MEDRYKFFSGVLSAMSAMVNLEIPWINVMSKMDLVTSNKGGGESGGARNGTRRKKDIARYVYLHSIQTTVVYVNHDKVFGTRPTAPCDTTARRRR